MKYTVSFKGEHETRKSIEVRAESKKEALEKVLRTLYIGNTLGLEDNYIVSID